LATATGGLKEQLEYLKATIGKHGPTITLTEPTVSDLTNNLHQLMRSVTKSNGNGFAVPEIYTTQHAVSRYEAVMAH
jgi:hypothetical protein